MVVLRQERDNGYRQKDHSGQYADCYFFDQLKVGGFGVHLMAPCKIDEIRICTPGRNAARTVTQE